MDCFTLPTDEDLYLTDKVWPNIKRWDYDDEGHFVILEWRPETPEEVKQRAAHDFDNIVVVAE